MTELITLNLLGLRCPEPLMVLRKNIRSLKEGQIIRVLTDDFSSTRDIKIFCHFMKHILLSFSIKKIPYQYIIKIGKIII
ncbi:two-component response regulator [Buchnera aphidicola (Cinara tujafilina)]|uniref:Two-component response regulator n=1 Tax=Buchnera aphidicola (Cinara tujafilina) TaxID=261317 RepID=F7WZJ7_9GAMM|nr:sulfurtransferase TusA [Buchnera aphidicola]AEH39864.1 two-component response regulator [Buchnera aphidicola (Cinara tujafilina)]